MTCDTCRQCPETLVADVLNQNTAGGATAGGATAGAPEHRPSAASSTHRRSTPVTDAESRHRGVPAAALLAFGGLELLAGIDVLALLGGGWR